MVDGPSRVLVNEALSVALRCFPWVLRAIGSVI
jgi:hypothetical protein